VTALPASSTAAQKVLVGQDTEVKTLPVPITVDAQLSPAFEVVKASPSELAAMHDPVVGHDTEEKRS
jgi:hypothetical protein